jgi:hypothetical protein
MPRRFDLNVRTISAGASGQHQLLLAGRHPAADEGSVGRRAAWSRFTTVNRAGSSARCWARSSQSRMRGEAWTARGQCRLAGGVEVVALAAEHELSFRVVDGDSAEFLQRVGAEETVNVLVDHRMIETLQVLGLQSDAAHAPECEVNGLLGIRARVRQYAVRLLDISDPE